MGKKDVRLKVCSETFNSIKYLKMSGLQDLLAERILGVRNQELALIKKQAHLQCLSIFTFWSIPMMVTTAVFATYTLTGHHLTPQKAFTVLSTFLTLQFPLSNLPTLLMGLFQANVSVKRVEEFLEDEEVDFRFIEYRNEEDAEDAIVIEKGSFHWDKPEDHSINPPLALKNTNITIKKGSFVAIIGSIGSGKSSLLNAVTGEMRFNHHDMPRVVVNGSLAVLPATPWILNKTVRDNVLFEEPYDEKKYKDVLKYSCLEKDLEVLGNGDMTEIGEKGMNLSGGQKSRIALARALYSNRDIYFMDDTLSAVDVHVGTAIVQECLMKYLEGKTRILITHNWDYLKYVEDVIIMNDGQVVQRGTYAQIKETPIYQDIVEKYKKAEQEKEEQAALSKRKPSRDLDENTDIPSEIKDAPKELMNSFLENSPIDINRSKSQEEEGTFRIGNRLVHAAEKEDEPVVQGLMLAEDREKGNVGWHVYKNYIASYGGKCYFALILLIMLIWLMMHMGSNFWLSVWSRQPPDSDQKFYIGIYALLACGYAVMCLARAAMILVKAVSSSQNIHQKMLWSVIRASLPNFFDRVPIGRLLNRFSKDLNQVDVVIPPLLGSAMVAAYFLLGDMVVCIFAGSYFVLPLIIVFFALAAYYQTSFMALNREVVRLEGISKSPIVSHLSETLNGLTTIRVYGRQPEFMNKQIAKQDDNIKNLLLSTALGNWFTMRALFSSMTVILPALFMIVVFKNEFGFTGALAGFAVTYILNIDQDILFFLQLTSNLELTMISYERCTAFMKVKPERGYYLNSKAEHREWLTQGTIQFSNYSARYRPNLPLILKDLNIRIQPQQKIGIVGRTGSGKSSLLLALLRVIEPSAGKIYIDGVDISELDLNELRQNIAVIPQEPTLFEGSLRENIDFMGNVPDDQIWDMLENIALKDKISELEGGLNYEIKDGGANLSNGERQLICIGRAILQKKKIILLDEATSNIDLHTEILIQETIKNTLKYCTVLTVAHRLKTVINSDKILVLKNGSVVEFDAPQTLLKNPDSLFAELWRAFEKESTFGDH